MSGSDYRYLYPGRRGSSLDTRNPLDLGSGGQAVLWHRFIRHQPTLTFVIPQVLKAVLSVMRFLAGPGVDGSALDAIPYLIER